MNKYQISGIVIVFLFYFAYLIKMMLQKKQGIQTNQLGKGENKSKETIKVENFLRVSSFIIVPIEIISIILNTRYLLSENVAKVSLVIGVIGVVVFITAMITMGNSWRAGVPQEDETKIITKGIYKISRNPAFLGFDLVYIGILLAFPNIILLIATTFAITMLHLQILQEEKYLIKVFGEQYEDYRKKTGRYFLFI